MPLVAQWLWLGLRYRSLTLPSVLNPAIETGGLAGESKHACLGLIGAEHARFVARTGVVSPGSPAERVRVQTSLAYPLIAKPDIGWCGYGVRRIDGPAELADYTAHYPAGASFLLQQHIPGPCEAGLFYSRPGTAAHGRIIAITLRHPPQVTGDGRASVEQLMLRDPRLASRLGAFRDSLGPARMNAVPAAGVVAVLSTVASLRVGGRYEDATTLVTPALDARLDAIARSMRNFHFGRFDVRCTDVAALRAGDFHIIEVNGAGSEAIHFWDPRVSLLAAYRGVFAKQRMMFALADRFRAAGRRPVGVVALSRAWLRQQRLTRGYPASN